MRNQEASDGALERPAGRRALFVFTAALALLVAAGSLTLSAVTINRLDELAELTRADTRATRVMVNDLARSLRETEGDLDAAMEGGLFDARAIVDDAIRSVVTIRCGRSLGSGFSYDIQVPPGYGSAILTNHHVVEDCTYTDGGSPTATLRDETFEGRLWSWDSDADLALIFVVEAIPPLFEAPQASGGDPVVTIGSPYGFDGTVSQGIVSKVFSDGFTTDAAIGHGNSGGPLLDRDGRVLGIITLNAYGADSLNFAVGIWEACGKILECPGR